MKERKELSSISIFGIEREEDKEQYESTEAYSIIRKDPRFKQIIEKINIEADTCPIIEDVLFNKRPNIF